MVRHLLGQAVVKVLRYDMAMRNWYKRIKKRRGSKIARVAAMRRMATIIWHMVKKNRRYEYANPIKKHQEFEQFSGEPKRQCKPHLDQDGLKAVFLGGHPPNPRRIYRMKLKDE